MNESPFAISGERLRDNGISVIPLKGKVPSTMSGGAWRPEHNWQRFCDRLPTPVETGFWERWPDAGVGAALGAASGPSPGLHLVAVDLDSDDPAVTAAVYAILPPSPVRKRGRKGHTAFYLASPEVKSRPYNDGQKQRLLDLLCHGRQTVLPPSIHPDTGEPFVWITLDTLETFDVADLPVLPDDIADKIGDALSPWGYEASPVALTLGAPGEGGLAAGDSVHRSLNEAALANLDAWVPALQLFGCWRTGDGKYKAVSHWRPSSTGRPLAKRATNLAISHDGIKDCGEQKGYTPLDLVMAACGADLDTAFRWLQDHVAPAKPVMLNLTAPKEPPATRQNVVDLGARRSNLAGLVTGAPPLRDLPPHDPETGEIIEPPSADVVVFEPAQPMVDTVLSAELCQPAGLLGEVVEWFNATASTPVPQMNLGAAISLLGAAMGRRWESPTRARTNFYIMGLADSGFGKDHPMDAARNLAIYCGLDKLMAAEETKSDSAIRKMLERYPVAFMLMDEFGGFMRKVLDRRAASHDKRMRDLMLTFFSRSNGDYMGAEGASERAVMIRNPHLCIYGASTPSDMWKAFDSASGEDGLLARFLVFEAGDKRPEWREPLADISEAPARLRQRVIDLMNVRPGGNLTGIGNTPTKPIRAAWGAGANEWWLAYREANVRLSKGAGPRATVYSRAAEHVVKLALVLAVGCEPKTPVITVSALEWAHAVVECSMAAIFQAMEDRVADSDKQAEYLWVKRFIQVGGGYGVSAVDLKKAVNGRFDKRRFDDIIGQLTDAGELESYVGSGPKGGKPAMRYRARAAEAEVA